MKSNSSIFSLLLVMLYVCNISISAQSVTASHPVISGYDSILYTAGIKHLDEFISRFNGFTQRGDQPDTYLSHEENILLLFDSKQFSFHKDSVFRESCQFAKTVVNKNVKLYKHAPDWYVSITCHGTLNHKDIQFKMHLSLEKRKNGGYKWVITGIDGTTFCTSRSFNHTELFISPVNHELNFMELPEITLQTYEFIDDYTKDNFRIDQLSTFLTLVRYGYLKINYVSDQEYTFLSVPGYKFTVSNLSRRELNSGWLITSLQKCDEIGKIILLNRVGKY